MNINLLIIFFIVNSLFSSDNISVNTPEKQGNAKKEAFQIYSKLHNYELSCDAFQYAYEGFRKIRDADLLKNDSILTIIDYSRPSNEKRLWVIDLKNCSIIECSLVAHGRGSGELMAETFSNTPHSHMSSLGFFITSKTYNGKHGYSLMIDGIEEGINQNVRSRAIVFHGADYVSDLYIKQVGRLGRSYGCPALPPDKNQRIIDLIKESSCVFIYSPDQQYLKSSKIITPRLDFQTAK